MTQNKSQNTVDELKTLVHKVCYQRQISQYHFRFGPKKYTQHQFVALLILYARSGKSLRDFVQSLYESKWPEWLQLKEIPTKSSIHRHFQRIGLKIIRALNLIVSRIQKTVRYAIDSTGIDARHASKHYVKRIGRTRSPFLKLSILAQSEKPFLIDDFAITDTHLHDVNHAKTLSKRFRLKNKCIFADRAYDCEELMQITEDSGNMLYCPIRNFNVKRPKGRLRRKLVKDFDEDIYHQGRNPVEMIMFLLKRKGLVIRAKKRSNKIKALAWYIVSYNIERLSASLQRLWEITISLDKALFKQYSNVLF
jgi:hypothetical protein